MWKDKHIDHKHNEYGTPLECKSLECANCGAILCANRTNTKTRLLKILDDYIDFTKGCRNESNTAFYKELKEYIKRK